jgi:sugar lactone lactonase YvrE
MKTKSQLFFLLLGVLSVGCSKNGSKPNQNSNSTNSPKTGVATIFAGNGQTGLADGKDVASFGEAWGIAMDKSGNLFVADNHTTLIRKVTPDGSVSTFAGNTTGASTGHNVSVDGTGTAASFSAPAGMTIDDDGNLFVADAAVIREITPAGSVTTVAGSKYYNNSNFVGITRDAAGNLYAADSYNRVILKISNGTSSIYAAGYPTGASSGLNDFVQALDLKFDSSGNLFFIDGADAIRKITTDKSITTIAGIPLQSGFTNGAGSQATFFNPFGIIIDAAGNLFVSDYGNRAIREILPNGNVSTVVLTNDGNTQNGPCDMVFDDSGNIYVAEGASILKVTLR